MAKWNYNNIPNQAGRVALVTGGPSGIGFQISLMLAKKGAEVILTYRDLNKAQQARNQILSEHPKAKLTLVKLDLSDLTSIAACAGEIKTNYTQLDLLINNAGVMVPPFTKTAQGFELQMGTNHLGHFALTGQLLPLANLLFIQELSKKLAKHHLPTIAVASHPGGSPTNLQRTSSYFMKHILTPLISQAPSAAALPTLRAACDPAVSSGSYWGPSSFFCLKGNPEQAKIPDRALDVTMAARLWELSEKLTGVIYEFNQDNKL